MQCEAYICTARFNLLEKDICMFHAKWKVLFKGNVNSMVGKSNEVDDVIGMFREASCNGSGNLLFELLHNCDLKVCNGRTMLNDLQFT